MDRIALSAVALAAVLGANTASATPAAVTTSHHSPGAPGDVVPLATEQLSEESGGLSKPAMPALHFECKLVAVKTVSWDDDDDSDFDGGG